MKRGLKIKKGKDGKYYLYSGFVDVPLARVQFNHGFGKTNLHYITFFKEIGFNLEELKELVAEMEASIKKQERENGKIN